MANRDNRVYDSGLVDGASRKERRLANDDATNMLFGSMTPPMPGMQPSMPYTMRKPAEPGKTPVNVQVVVNNHSRDNSSTANVSSSEENTQVQFRENYVQGIQTENGQAFIQGNGNNQSATESQGTTDAYVMQQRLLNEQNADKNFLPTDNMTEEMRQCLEASVANENKQQQEALHNSAIQQPAYNEQSMQPQTPQYASPFGNQQGGNMYGSQQPQQPAYGASQPAYNEQPMQPQAPQYASPFGNQQGSNMYSSQQPQQPSFGASQPAYNEQPVQPQAPQYASPFGNQQGSNVYGSQQPQQPAYGASQPAYNEQLVQPQAPQYTSPFGNQQGSNMYGSQQPQQGFSNVPYYAETSRETYNYNGLQRPKENANIYGKRIISVYSPKGGSGKSSVTKELACAFVRDDASINGRKPKVLLVDLDFSACDLHTIFSIPPSPNIMSWVNMMRRDIQATGSIPPYDKYTIDKFIRHNVHEGLDILVGPPMNQESKLFTVEIVSAICKNLKACDYDIVIYDNAPSKEEETLRILEQSDDVLCLCTLDTTTIAELSEFLKIARERSFDASKLKLVINNVPTDSKNIDIFPQDIIDLYDIKPLGQLPHDDNVRLSNNSAYALLLDKKETPYVKSMKNIANALVPIYREEKQGLFARLFGKKK